jgi:hypothetical protein
MRRIWPIAMTVTADGSQDVPEDSVVAAVDAVLQERGTS